MYEHTHGPRTQQSEEAAAAAALRYIHVDNYNSTTTSEAHILLCVDEGGEDLPFFELQFESYFEVHCEQLTCVEVVEEKKHTSSSKNE